MRMTSGGIHLKLGIEPDICVLAKAIGNGYPMAAIIGKKDIMNAAQKTFISSTYWTDRIGPAAAIATIKKHIKCDASSHLVKIGELVQKGWRSLAEKYRLNIEVTGIPPLSHWKIKTDESELAHTFIVKKMLEKGFLTSRAFYATCAHTEKDVDHYLKSLEDVLKVSADHIREGKIKKLYKGPPAHTGFKRLA